MTPTPFTRSVPNPDIADLQVRLARTRFPDQPPRGSWSTGAVGSSFWPYCGRLHGSPPLPKGATIGVPVGYAAVPKEIIRPPRDAATRVLTNIQRWTEMKRGGHFAALEQPEALAAEIAAFFRPLR